MRAIGQGGASSKVFPVLQLFAVLPVDDVTGEISGLLTDIDSGTFEIFDKDGTSTEGPSAIDTTNDRLGLGRYAAVWSVPSDELVGAHTITWTYKFTAAGTTYTLTRSFEVFDSNDVGNPLAHMYTTVASMRAEGISKEKVKDARLIEGIELAGLYIESFTGNVFEPVGKQISMDGRGGQAIILSEPIVAIGDVTIDTSPFFPSDLQIDPSLFRVYNRHLSQAMTHPDDRSSPKIEFFHANRDFARTSFSFDRLFFPYGQQNIHIEGAFGYTDPNGLDLVGITPKLIARVAQLFVIRNLPKLAKTDERDELKRAHLLQELRTRDQQIKYNFPTSGLSSIVGPFTGDPEIDTLLVRFRKPMGIAAT